MRLYYRAEEKIYTTKRENLFLVPKMLKFIEKQLRKEYIRLLKLSRAVPVFLQEIRVVRSEQCRTINT